MDQSATPSGTRYGVPALRDRITSRLTEAYGQNMLEQAEFERRLELAQQAQTIEELQAIVADFGPGSVRPEDGSVAPRRRQTQVMASHSEALQPGRDEQYRGLNIMGESVLDLRAFRGSGATLVLTLSGCMAEYRLKVPRGTRLVRESRLVMGELQHKLAGQPGLLKTIWKRLVGGSDSAPASPFPLDGPPPTLILRGTLVMGTLVIQEEEGSLS